MPLSTISCGVLGGGRAVWAGSVCLSLSIALDLPSLWLGPLLLEEVITTACAVCIPRGRWLALMEWIYDLVAVEMAFMHCLRQACPTGGPGRL